MSWKKGLRREGATMPWGCRAALVACLWWTPALAQLEPDAGDAAAVAEDEPSTEPDAGDAAAVAEDEPSTEPDAGDAAVVAEDEPSTTPEPSPLADPDSPVTTAELAPPEEEETVTPLANGQVPLADDEDESPSVEPVAAEQSYEPILAKPPRPPTPFDQGRIRLGLGLGWISSTTTEWLMLGGGAGYFVLDGLELGASSTLWVVGDPFIATLTPEVRYVLHFVPTVKPYVGAFYRHYFVTGGFRDTDSVGGRAGVFFMTGTRSYFGAGAVYERFLDQDLFVDRDQVYPEITFALAF